MQSLLVQGGRRSFSFFFIIGLLIKIRFKQHRDSRRLARIFHTGSLRGTANPDVDKEGDGLRRRLYVSYCPRSNSRLTQYPSGVRKPQQNQYEISGLALFQLQTTRREQKLHTFCIGGSPKIPYGLKTKIISSRE